MNCPKCNKSDEVVTRDNGTKYCLDCDTSVEVYIPNRMLPIPEVIARRPYDDDKPNGYMESDRDFLENNMDACLWFLENVSKIEEILCQIEQL